MGFSRRFSIHSQRDSSMNGSIFQDGDEGTLVLGESGAGITVVYIGIQDEDILLRCTRLY